MSVESIKQSSFERTNFPFLLSLNHSESLNILYQLSALEEEHSTREDIIFKRANLSRFDKVYKFVVITFTRLGIECSLNFPHIRWRGSDLSTGKVPGRVAYRSLGSR